MRIVEMPVRLRRRLLAALVIPLICTVLVGLAPTAPAGAISAPYTVTTLHFLVRIGPNSLGDPRTCDVIGDVYTPRSASVRHPVPALLTTNGFAGSKNDRAGLAAYGASHGYVVLAYSGLGSGGSGCKITLDDPATDGRAASQLVSYLGGAPGIAFLDAKHTKPAPTFHDVIHDAVAHNGKSYKYDPRVGMMGSSYGGAIQFAAASVDPRIDAIVPMITWNDLSYSLDPNNTGQTVGVSTSTPGATKLDFGLLLAGAGVVTGLAHVQEDPSGILPCPNFSTFICPALATAAVGGFFEPAAVTQLRHASVASYLSKVRIPTLLMQGEGDTLFNLNEATATYEALRKQGTPVKMVWMSWGHSQPTPAPGEYDANHPDAADQYDTRRMFNWFDHYLKGDQLVSTGPQFAWFRNWVPYHGIATPAYGQANTFPVGTTRAYYLSGKTLASSSKAIHVSRQSFLTPPAGVPTSLSKSSALNAYLAVPVPEVDLPGTYAQFTTPTLARPLDVVGSPRLTLRVDAPIAAVSQAAGPAGDLVLFVRIQDVGPNGKASDIEQLVAPVRVANVRRPFTVTLPGIVHQFGTGHRLRIVVTGGSTAYRGGLVPSPVTIATGSPSQVLRLPVTP